MRNHLPFTYSNMKWLINKYGKTNKQIAEEIVDFINSEPVKQTGTAHTVSQLTDESVNIMKRGYLEPEFYGYYCDYDWVVFCWLFGKMIDLPKGFPMYCKDLKQMYDELNSKMFPIGSLETPEEKMSIRKLSDYPEQTNEHKALSDAKWNFELYKFLDEL